MSSHQKMVVLGLDCATPELVFDRFKGHLPNIEQLMRDGHRGILRSTIPPITVPAWTSMTTGKDPGQLGLYGFRNRLDHSYRELTPCNNSAVNAERIWDVLGRNGFRSIVIGVPQTFPPRILNGVMVSGFMTPSVELDYTVPASLANELENLFGEYLLDVQNFRTTDRESVLSDITLMTKQRFALIRHLIQREAWDFLMMVEIGLDRAHHVFWHSLGNSTGTGGNGSGGAILDYHVLLDAEIGEALKLVPDDAQVLIVSDHGAKPLKGGFCINQWLMEEGYLSLREPVTGLRPVSFSSIDWERTRAWGAGGYYARVFLNVADREPSGLVPAKDYHRVRAELAEKIEGLAGADGEEWENRVIFPEDAYQEVNGVAPDMIAYLDDLNIRSIGSVGHPRLWTEENDEGADYANHAEDGLFICRGEWPGIDCAAGRLDITELFGLIRANFGIQG